MRKLWVDGRLDPPSGWEVAKTFSEARLALLKGDVDVISIGLYLGTHDCLGKPRCWEAAEKRWTCSWGKCKCFCHIPLQNGCELLRWMGDFMSKLPESVHMHPHGPLEKRLMDRVFEKAIAIRNKLRYDESTSAAPEEKQP